MTEINVLAIIPIRGGDKEFATDIPVLGGKSLIAYTVEAALKSRMVNKVVVSTDSELIKQQGEALGAEVPFQRPPELSGSDVPLDRVLQHCVEWLEKNQKYFADIVVLMEITHPLREEGLIDKVVETLLRRDLDSVFVAHEERHSFWMPDDQGVLKKVGEGEYLPRHLQKPIYREISGLVCATRARFVKEGTRLGNRVGLVPIGGIGALIDTHDEIGLWVAKKILESQQGVEKR